MNTDHCYNASVDGGGNVTVDLYINASMEDEELCSSSCIEGSVDMDPVDSVDNMEDSVDMDVEDSVSMNMEVSVDIVMEVSVNLDMEDSVDIDTEDTLINGREPLEEIATASDILSNLDEEEMIMLFLPAIMVGVVICQRDGRSLRHPRGEAITVRSDFFPKLKAQRSRKAYRKTVRCTPESFEALCETLEPTYYRKYGLPGSNQQYTFDRGLAVLLTYFGNGCGQDGDGLGGTASQIGMSRSAASLYIKNIEDLLYDMMEKRHSFSSSDSRRRIG
ncbi:hypothetical protein PR001_g4787 [Phytophthora rubi]|uniref:DDE Tnp4 domain-containing protein n=1 Tax=Phytophthora rubi TaxID=129364 RepID=A0A6A3NMW7_9STRA|nr:hypothetical protein PR001_g4787 [Phytophthora rubi]